MENDDVCVGRLLTRHAFNEDTRRVSEHIAPMIRWSHWRQRYAHTTLWPWPDGHGKLPGNACCAHAMQPPDTEGDREREWWHT